MGFQSPSFPLNVMTDKVNCCMFAVLHFDWSLLVICIIKHRFKISAKCMKTKSNHQYEKRTTNKVLNSHRININKIYMTI